MDVDSVTDDWILISAPTPKKRSAPKAIPVPVCRRATSLEQPLKRGGRPAPEFFRPVSLTTPPTPTARQWGPEPTVDAPVNMPQDSSKHKSSRHVSAPRGCKAGSLVARASNIPRDLLARWMILINTVGSLSSIWQEYHQSPQFETHCQRLLEKYAPSTLFKYINTLQCIYSILLDFAWTWKDIGCHRLSDLLQIAHEGKHSEWGFGASTAIKALLWAQKLLMISEWQSLYDPIVNSFFNPSNHERRESIPLSLFLVVQWERRLLMKECSVQEQVILGGFLCLLWGGLRFADGQRVSLKSLSWCITALRGSCYRTKTSRSGQPWAIQARGFLSHGSWSWVAQWLTSLDIIWSYPHDTPSESDFLLPMTHGDGFSCPLVPMPYSQALHWLRYFCTLPWKNSVVPASANPTDYTLHSLKTTTLSWSNQLAQKGLVTEEQRHLQGHHRQGSMRLYSRDDTAGQLALQDTLIQQVQGGHRFVTPLHRGSQRPIQEPAVQLERFKKGYQTYNWKFFEFNNATTDPILEGIPASHDPTTAPQAMSESVESSGSSSSSSSSSASGSDTEEVTLGDAEELVVARVTRIQHMMLVTDDCCQPKWNDQHFRAACGARLPRDNCVFDTQLNPTFGMCRHAACFKRWQQVSALGE